MNSPVELAKTLIARASDDEYVFRKLAADTKAPDWVLGFHAQQSVEKSIKAVLAAKGLEFPRTHNLAMLLEILVRAGTQAPLDEEMLSSLIPYGVAMRYDDSLADELPPLLRDDVHRCVIEALAWATRSIA